MLIPPLIPYAAVLQSLKVVLELLVNGARWIRSPVPKTSTSSRYLFIMYGLVCVLLDVVPALPRNRSNRTLTSCRAMLRHGVLHPAIAYGGKVNDVVCVNSMGPSARNPCPVSTRVPGCLNVKGYPWK
uniref:Uncharacterized protein n=1 Tax=Anopheles coluzzii TaxID=1518534 RepID=A0A8W7PBI8_ANOCL